MKHTNQGKTNNQNNQNSQNNQNKNNNKTNIHDYNKNRHENDTNSLNSPNPVLVPKLLVVIIDRGETKRLEEVLNEKHVHFRYMFNSMGTANSEILKAFGLSGTEKTICVCIETAFKVQFVMTAIVERMTLTIPGNGIAFILPVSGMSAALSQAFDRLKQFNIDKIDKNERLEELMEQIEKIEKESESENPVGDHYELIVSVINQGFSEILMEAAKAAGARGGTIIHARRMGVNEDVKFFGITVQSEKEIVAIVISHSKKIELMRAITKVCGMRTEAHGIVLALPVENCAGLDINDINTKNVK